MLTITNLRDAEKFVTKQQGLSNDIRWDNYDLVFFRPAAQGVYSKDGAFRNGEWGFENRVPVTDAGTWEINYRDVRRAPKNRN